MVRSAGKNELLPGTLGATAPFRDPSEAISPFFVWPQGFFPFA
jgi:hypothetical protein